MTQQEILSATIFKTCSDAKGPAERHIFFDIMAFAKPQTLVQERLGARFLFKLIQDLVQTCRNHSPRGAKILKKQIDAYQVRDYDLENFVLRLAIDSIYHPAVALFYYRVDIRYDLAMDHLEQSIRVLTQLYKLGVTESAMAIVEQKINQLRICSRIGAQLEAEQLIDSMLDLLLHQSENQQHGYFYPERLKKLPLIAQEKACYVLETIRQITTDNQFESMRKSMLALINSKLSASIFTQVETALSPQEVLT